MYQPVILNHANPMLRLIRDIISAEEADHIMGCAKPLLTTAQIMGYGGDNTSEGRTNSVCWLDKNHDELIACVCQRIADCVGMALSHAEKIQVVHYTKGQEFKPHFDAIRPVSIHAQNSLKNLGGQRLLTALVYLNKVDSGGETYFPHLNIKQIPEAFSMLVFSNTKGDSHLPDPLSQHGAAPVVEGEKWAFNLWFRERPTGF